MKTYKELIDEISRRTLGSYIKKASDSLDDESYAAGKEHAKGNSGAGPEARASKRKKGIATATDKLTKEELEQYSIEDILEYIQTEEYAQLDELSKKTLGSYIKKAVVDIKAKSAKGGEHAEKADHHDAQFHNPDKYPSGWKAQKEYDDHHKYEFDKNDSAASLQKNKASKRAKGVNLATDKLTRESLDEYTLDEILEFIQTEEYAQLNELSKKTLGSYIKKATQKVNKDTHDNSFDREKAWRKIEKGYDDGDHETVRDGRFSRMKAHKADKKIDKHISGIATATDKLTRESIDTVLESILYESSEQ